jgi:Dolichyl-phosphate-mannose-protein mannosyltransferase
MQELIVHTLLLLGALNLLLIWFVRKTAKPSFAPKTPPDEESELSSCKVVFIFAVVVSIVGLAFRLYGFNRSLWLDEFGTLWVIEGSFSQLMERVNAFQGQSPLYYLLAWLFVHLIGESEFTLRLLSLLLGVGTVYGIYVFGNFLYGRNAGLISASFLWLSSSMVYSGTDARPYALALFMAVIMFYGFGRAAQTGERFGRLLFIVGGVGLFSTHYILILVGIGIALGYVLFPRLRSQYRSHQFALDVGAQVVLVSWCFPQIFQLWSRRESLSWLGFTNYLIFFELIGPFVVIALAPYLSGKRLVASDFQHGMAWVLGLAIGAQVGFLYLLAYFGTNLLHPRYMIIIVVPAALLASRSFVQLPRYSAATTLLYWLIFTGVYFIMDFRFYGTFSRVGFQDWRNAVACLDKFMRSEPKALVLYRAGFVEEDGLIKGQITPAALSPLRSPGHQPVSWNLIQLTHSWIKPGRKDYFERTVEPAIHSTPVFYFFSCGHCFNQLTGQYSEALIAWVEEKFPGRFRRESIQAGRGITLIRFVDRFTVTSLKGKQNATVSTVSSQHAELGKTNNGNTCNQT